MPHFSGTLKLKVCEAMDLRPTEYATRHANVVGKQQTMLIDPYVAVDIDEIHVDRSTTKQKTFKPVWNECFTTDVHNGQNLGLTVFHDAAIPPDDFVANCTISFDELLNSSKESGKNESDVWVCYEFSPLLAFSQWQFYFKSDMCCQIFEASELLRIHTSVFYLIKYKRHSTYMRFVTHLCPLVYFLAFLNYVC